MTAWSCLAVLVLCYAQTGWAQLEAPSTARLMVVYSGGQTVANEERTHAIESGIVKSSNRELMESLSSVKHLHLEAEPGDLFPDAAGRARALLNRLEDSPRKWGRHHLQPSIRKLRELPGNSSLICQGAKKWKRRLPATEN